MAGKGGMDSRWRPSWRASVRDIPGGHLPCATSIDDTGEQSKGSGSLIAVRTKANATIKDPVAQ